MFTTTSAPTAARNPARFAPVALAAAIAFCATGSAFAASTGGFSTTDGGSASGSKSFSASSYTQIQQILEDAKDGNYPVVITYTGNEDSLINQIVKDHTVDSSGNCPKAHWNDTYRKVEIKEMTKGVTIQGANGSSANFGIVVNKSSNVIIRNMKIGALGGANNDADMIRIDSGVNVWVDHNELFAVNNECKGSPDGDLTFESAIDIKKESQNVTVSYNVIRDSKKVGLDGSSSSDIAGGRKITFHHNIYRNVSARLPLQRGGWTHMYNNLYDGITSSGINVRQKGYALIESNWFQNAVNPVTCRFDSSNCGYWDLRNNNVRNPGDFSTYNITWTSGGTIDATNWTTTATFPISIPYSYSPVTPQCVKDKLASYAGVGKNGATLTSSACGGTTTSSSSSVQSSAANSSVAAGNVNLSGSAGNAAVSLYWSVSNTSINALEIYQDTDSDPAGRVRIASLPITNTAYTATGLSNGTTYYFWVKYRTTDGVWHNSNVFSAKPASGSTTSSSSSAASSSASGAPVLSGTGDYPSGFSKCADLGGTCSVTSGDGWVAFGRKGNWVLKKVSVGSSIACTVAAFGSDPQGNPNKCSYKK
ncbi:pectate lyase [Cellvibrio sp. NN19]|uniref:pectate lyase family protein n=1 Tax=Cellvibrio chitinivorans TaxID=3102792 RepID=UPI002B406A7B|nr:pectate lyase [Cellvibrio sp. NN19]